VAQAQRYVAEGYGVVVDLDLEKFFDRVHGCSSSPVGLRGAFPLLAGKILCPGSGNIPLSVANIFYYHRLEGYEGMSASSGIAAEF
jgi:hypothetical protein